MCCRTTVSKFRPERDGSRPPAPEQLRPADPRLRGDDRQWMTFILIFERFSSGVDLKINAEFYIREGRL
jgi:hypothetical protein